MGALIDTRHETHAFSWSDGLGVVRCTCGAEFVRESFAEATAAHIDHAVDALKVSA